MTQRPLFDSNIQNSPLNSRRLSRMGEIDTPLPADQLVNLSTNENAFGVAQSVIDAIQREASTLNRYPARTGELQLREKLAALHGHGFVADNFVLGNSGSEILDHAAVGFLQPGDEVISFRPTFGFYPGAARRCGASMVWLDLHPSDNFHMDVDRILEAITAKTRVVYLCNPNNPTGNIMTHADYVQLLAALPKHVLVVSDEVYYQYVTSPDYVRSAEFIQQGYPLIQLFSFSKAHGLAGLRLGYGVARVDIADYMASLQRTFQVGRIPIAAGSAAIDAQAHIDYTVKNTLLGRDWLLHQLRELDLTVWESETNYLLLDVGREGVSAELIEHGIVVADGKRRFDLPTCIRVTVGLPEHNQKFITALHKVLTRL